MLNWLKKLLRRWIDEGRSVDTIECFVGGRFVRASVEGVAGLKLIVNDGTGSWLVDSDACPNKSDFWRAWEQRMNEALVWEGGDKFDPKEMER